MNKIVKIFVGLILFLGLSFALFKWLKSHQSPQLFGQCFHRVDTSEKVIALTFDDGPSPYTEQLLDVLRKHEAKATFFLLGRNAEKFPQVARRIHEEYHEIGNHSYSHQPFIFKSRSFMREEIEKTDAIIRQAGYTGTIHFRAPYGRKLIGLPWILRQSNRPHILFDVIPDDWARPGVDVIVNRVLADAKPGSIVLLHDGDGDESGQDRAQTIEAIPAIIQKLRLQGYRFVTVSELLEF